jgi:hypothetical protein
MRAPINEPLGDDDWLIVVLDRMLMQQPPMEERPVKKDNIRHMDGDTKPSSVKS